jgi:bifunctional non-homologous end joining protein LigD
VALDVYRKKRKFSVTSEPRGRTKRGRSGFAYVIQKHAATRLHYDLRLELDGVMKSWAVTRGPSLNPDDKRLAVHVEDHPIEYNKFEGTIPRGEYGGGTVMIWDRGTWTPEGDPHRGLAKGHLEFELHGDKLRGRWHLVRLKARPKERGDNWLLIKGKDDEARGSRDKDILDAEPDSAATGRSIDEIADGKGKKRVWHSNRGRGGKAVVPQNPAATKPGIKPWARPRKSATAAAATAQKKSAGGARLPDFVPPSLATQYEKPPSGKNWLHEIKYDGYRLEARLDRGKVKLLTRNEQDWTHRFKPIAAAVAALPAETALLDGELVVEDDKGVSNFSLLQIDLKAGRYDRLVYYVFDLLHLNGRDLTGEPLTARKAALQQLLKAAAKDGRIRYTEHLEEDGATVFRHARDMHLEGIISKRKDAPYRSGRTDNFIKSKTHDEQEFIVAGFSPASALPHAVGALTVAVREDGELRYAGRVGTGYTRDTARDLWKRLKPLQVNRPPLELPPDERRKDVIWVKPELVVEAEFRGITHDKLLRQASFKGVREDKPAREVVRELPVAAAARRPATKKSAKPKVSAMPKASVKPKTPAKPAGGRAKADAPIGNVRLSHPDRVYWPDVGVTKQDLAEYYVSVWDWMAPHIVGRPLALLRAPEGVGGETFFQKHIAANVKNSALRHYVNAKEHDVIVVEQRDDLIALVQSGALEIHVRGSRLKTLDVCDRIVFDLDPGEGVAWKEIVAAAREIRERLEGVKLQSFAKLTGGKGIHVMVPIDGADWDAAKDFSQAVVMSLVADSPQRYVGKMTKSLRKGKIFIDYFRNSREATSVAAYSTRARPGAAVSAPLSWEQLGRVKGADAYTVLNLTKTFKQDPWAGLGKVRQKLPKP